MPSFDVVSEVDKHELTNAVDQANRELATRFDFKGTPAKFELNEFVVTQHATTAFQLKQMFDILRGRFSARGIDTRCLDAADAIENLGVLVKWSPSSKALINRRPSSSWQPLKPPSSKLTHRFRAKSFASQVRNATICSRPLLY